MDTTLVEVPEVLVIAASIGGVAASIALLLEAVRQRRTARAIGAHPRLVIARIALRSGVVRTLCALGFLAAGATLVQLPPRPGQFGVLLRSVTSVFLLCSVAVLVACVLDIKDRRRLIKLLSVPEGREESPPTPLAS